jgi:amidase
MHISRRRVRGQTRGPGTEETQRLAAAEHLSFDRDEAEAFAVALDGLLATCARLDELDDAADTPPVFLNRNTGRAPTAAEDPLHAYLWLCEVGGPDEGPLAGLRGAVKDNIDIAGVPTTNGSRTTPHLPMRDAAVIERLVQAGARIVGKLNMDDFATGVTGESSSFGPTLNPYDTTRSAGGSSSGAGAAVVAGTIDFSLAVDQGGSARIPAAYCGGVTTKPTHGLVPSHGVSHIDNTIDYVCPVARDTALVARLLDVMSGHDDRDGQWVRGRPTPISAVSGLDCGVAGLRIGVVAGSAAEELCSPGIRDAFTRAQETLTAGGAQVRTVGIGLWEEARFIGYPIYAMSMWATSQSDGQGWGHRGEIDILRARHFALVRRTESDQLPPMLKTMLLFGRFLQEHSLTWYYGKAQNLRRLLRQQIDAALTDCDVLITPTTIRVAPPLAQSPKSDLEFVLSTVAEGGENTVPLNLSGHPATAVPMGTEDGLPVSLQVIGREFDDALTLAVARVVEAATPIPAPPQRPPIPASPATSGIGRNVTP